MDKELATQIIKRFDRLDNVTKEDEEEFIEASNYLIEVENDNKIMAYLGGYYYEKRQYDLAEEYYLLADHNGNKWAAGGLGYIYYYGRNGVVDYSKAMKYFLKAKENGDLEAAMKIADMYHNGYGVEKDDDIYKSLLLEIYEKVKNSKDLFCPFPEVAHRLAEIYIKEGREDFALPLLNKGRDYITQRIRYNAFWGNFVIAKRIVTLQYKIVDFDESDIDFFDLLYVLQTPHKVKLTFRSKTYLIESYFEGEEIRVRCENKTYQYIDKFLREHLFDNKHTYIIHYEEPYFLDMVD